MSYSMDSMDKRLLISIGGGYATGVEEVATKLKGSISKLFSDAVITIIDLDRMAERELSREYNNEDYNFDQIFLGLDDKSHKGIDIVILCGCYALYDKRINKKSKLKIFLDCDNDKRLVNLISKREVASPEQLSGVITEYMDHLRPEMQKYIEPTRANADLIIPYENEAVGSSIILDGVIKVIEAIDGGASRPSATAVWNYESERMDVEKERYYDLS